MSQQEAPPQSAQLSSRSGYAPGPITYQPAPLSSGPLSTNSDFMDTLQSAAARAAPKSVQMPVGLPSQRGSLVLPTDKRGSQHSVAWNDEDLAVQDDDAVGGDPKLFHDADLGNEVEAIARSIRPYSAARTRDSGGGARSVSGIEVRARVVDAT